MAERKVVTCWCCALPCNTFEIHHLIQRQFGGDDSERNRINLCRTCHDLLDRGGMTNIHFASWLIAERHKEPNVRWANLLLLKFYEVIMQCNILLKEREDKEFSNV